MKKMTKKYLMRTLALVMAIIMVATSGAFSSDGWLRASGMEEGFSEDGSAEDNTELAGEGDSEDGDPEGGSEDGDSEAGGSEDGDPEAGGSEDGDPEAGGSEDGDPEAGGSGDGDPEAGSSEKGDCPADCTLEKGHEGNCIVTMVVPRVKSHEEGCILNLDHEGECEVAKKHIDGCILPSEHDGDCAIKECEKGCTLDEGHDGDCAVKECEKGCTLEKGHDGDCAIKECEKGCTLEKGHDGDCAVRECEAGCELEKGHDGACELADTFGDISEYLKNTNVKWSKKNSSIIKKLIVEVEVDGKLVVREIHTTTETKREVSYSYSYDEKVYELADDSYRSGSTKSSSRSPEVTVVIKLTKIPPTVTLIGDKEVYVSGTAEINATVKNSSAAVVWTSSDETIATVDANGVVTGVADGEVEITAAVTENGKEYSSDPYVITVKAPEITIEGAKEVLIGGNVTLTKNVIGVDSAEVTWTSSDETIAIVNNGVVTGVEEGSTQIVAAITVNGKEYASAPYNVMVKAPFINIEGDEEVFIEKTITLTATVNSLNPGGAVAWTSSDETIATVDANGVVTGIALGTVVITAKEVGTDLQAEKEITVTDVLKYTVTFNANGGTGVPEPVKVEAGQSLGSLFPAKVPYKDGNYAFDGWRTSATGSTEFTSSTVVNHDMTVYAKWSSVSLIKDNPVPAGPDGGTAVDGLQPGEVAASKEAEWVDYDNKIAKIEFNLQGIPVKKGSDVIIVLDKSSSMRNTWTKVDRWTPATEAVEKLAETLLANSNEDNNRVALVQFASDVENSFNFQNNLGTFKNKFEKVLSSGTNYTIALQQALYFASTRTAEEEARPLYVVFISDGEPNSDGAAQASALKSAGATIYSVGIQISSSNSKAINALNKVSSNGTFTNVDDVDTDLNAVLQNIAASIKKAATEAVLVDVVSNYFNLLNSGSYGLPEGATAEGSEVTIEVGDIIAETKTISIYVQLKEAYRNQPNRYLTNAKVDLNYKDVNDRPANKDENTMGKPSLNVDSGGIEIRYILVNEEGQYINQEGIVLGTGQEAFKVLVDSTAYKYNGSTNLQYSSTGVKYNVEPQNAPAGYILHSSEPAYKEVTLKSTQMAVVEYKVYKIGDAKIEVEDYTGIYDAAAHGVTVNAPAGVTLKYSLDGNTWQDTPITYTDVTNGAQTVYVKASAANAKEKIVSATVTINPKPVTVTAADDSKVYGEADPVFTATASGTLGTDTVSYAVTREAGENVGTYAITPSGAKLQGNYTVTYVPATFTINPKEVTVTAVNKIKTYGSADPVFTATVTGTTEKLEYTVTREAGENIGTYVITPSGAKLQGNYTVTYVPATLTINAKAVVVTAEAKTKVYGEADPALTAKVDGIVGTDKLTYTVTREVGEDAGSYAITAAGEAVQGNYTVTYVPGTFEITKRVVTLKSADLSKEYDGTALTNGTTPLITEDGWVTGEGATYEFTGSQTVVGESSNAFAYTMKEGTKASNYTINKTEGTLTVTQCTAEIVVNITGNSDNKVYNGSEQSVSGYDVSINSSLYTEADFTFNGEATAKGTVVGTYPMGLKAGQFANASENFAAVTFNVTDGELNITPVTEKVTVIITENSGRFTYDGTEKTVTGYKVTSISNPLYTAADFAFSGYAAVIGTDAGTYDMGLAAENFTNKNTNFTNVEFVIVDGKLVIDPISAEVVVEIKENSGSYVYDRTEKTVTGYEVTSISSDLYTKADFTFNGEAVVKGTAVGTYDMEVTAAEFENTNTNFTNVRFVITDGQLEITPATDAVVVTIKENGGTFTYDGTEKEVTGYKVTSISNPLYKETDFTFNGNAAVKGTEVGTYNMEVKASDFTNKNTNFTEVVFQIEDGKLEINPVDTKVVVTITENSGSFPYDGEVKEVRGYSVTSISNKLYTEADFAFSGSAVVKGTNAGTYQMELVSENFTNTNANFANVEFVVIDGSLTITPVQDKVVVTITENNGTAVYNGKEHSVTGYDVAINGAMYTEADFTFNGNAVVKGTDAGTYDMGLVAEDFTNTNDNFSEVEFVIVDGSLTIGKAPITFTSASDSKVYDGTALTNHEVIVGGNGFVEGEGASFQVTGNQTVAGTSKNTFTYTFNEGTKDSNYTVDKTEGNLVVTELIDEVIVTITENSDTVVYDGKEHSVTGYTVSINNDLYTEADFTFNGNAVVKGTEVGTYSMEVEASDFTNTNANFANVKFVVKDGSLKITPVEGVVVTITENSGSKVYNGSEQSVEGYAVTSISNDLYTEEDFAFNGEAIAKGTNVGTYNMAVEKADFVNKNKNFDNVTFEVVDGTLTITPITDEVVVNIAGNKDSKVYNGSEQSVEGYEVTGISYGLYKASSIRLNGKALAAGTEVGKYLMGLAAENFENTSKNFTNVRFNVTDGELDITPVTDKVTVTITENSGTYTYDGTEKTVTGYKVTEISNVLYTEADFTFSGNAAVSGTDAGTYEMGLVAANFTNNSPNFTNVEFVIVDGKLVINPISAEVVVKITENSGNYVYDKTEKTVTGYEVTEISNALYTETDFTFNGNAVVKGTEVGTYNMEVKASDFTNKNANFTNVKFVVADGQLKITPAEGAVVVTIKENDGTYTYDGTEKEVSGYTVTNISNALYTEADFTFSGNAVVKGTNAGTYQMELVPENFTNTNANFTNVVFQIEHGKLVIKPVEAKVVVTITENSGSAVYDGMEKEVSGYTVTNISNALYTEADFTFSGNAVVKGTNAGTYQMELVPENFTNTNADFANVEFVVRDGSLVISPLQTEVVVNITENSGSAVYDGIEKEVSGYTVTSINNVLYTEADFTFNGEAIATGTDAGTYQMNVKAEDFSNTNKNFAKVTFVINDGSLKIEKAQLVITTPSESKAYDGTALTAKGSMSGLVNGETASLHTTGTQTLVGSSQNTYKLTWDGTAKAANYEVKENIGTLTITDDLEDIEKVVKKTHDNKEYALGETVTFTIRIKNIYDTEKTATVSEIPGVNIVGATQYSMKPGEVIDVTATYVVTEADILAQGFTNTVTVTFDEKEYKDEDIVDVVEKDGKLTITKEAVSTPETGNGYALGETIIYKITATNTGNVTINNVVITDELTGENWQVESLVPGASAEFTTVYTVTEADILAGKVVNVATGTAKDPEGKDVEVIPGTEEELTAVPAPSLGIDKEVPEEKSVYHLNEVVTYRIRVSNNGNVTLTNIKIEDPLTGDEWEIPSLAPAGFRTFAATYTVTAEDIAHKDGKLTNVVTAEANSPAGEVPKASDTEDVVIAAAEPSIIVTKDAVTVNGNAIVDGYRAKAGDVIGYTITVTNAGNVNVTNVTVKDELVAFEEVVEILAPAAVETFNVTYTVTEADVINGIVVNAATVTGTAPGNKTVEDDAKEEIPTEDVVSALGITKETTNEAETDGKYALGETITYKITATNTGNITLKNVIVKDELTGDTWNIASLIPGAFKEFTAEYVVTEMDIIEGKVLNVATATAEDEDPKGDPEVKEDEVEDPTDDKDSELTLTKETTSKAETDDKYALGETITYKITATNTGNVTLTDVVVVDELTGDTWNVDGEMKPGGTVEFTAKYVVTEADILEGKVLNVATATAKDPEKEEPVVIPGEKEEPTDDKNPAATVDKNVIEEIDTEAVEAKWIVGDTVQYEIIVKNTGNITLTDLAVDDDMNAAGDAKFKNLAALTEAGIEVVEIDQDSVILKSLAPGAEVKLLCEYTILREDAGKEISNGVAIDNEQIEPSTDEEVTPVERLYNLIINYVDAAGNVLAPQYVAKLVEGEIVSVNSPAIAGYTTNVLVVTTAPDGMPAKDVEIYVVYTAIPSPGSDEDDPEPTPDPVTPEPTPMPEAVPTPEPGPAPAPVAPPVEVSESGTYAIVEDGEGGYILTPIEEIEVPLADIDLGVHKCCILHFLIMLAAFIILAAHMRNQKKRQARIFELRETIELEKAKKDLGEGKAVPEAEVKENE